MDKINSKISAPKHGGFAKIFGEKTQNSKLKRLKEILKRMKSVVVAFSGGVDSTFLLKVARDTLDGKVIAVTARSATYPESEFKEAKTLAKSMGVWHIIIDTKELDKKDFSDNPPDRCYWCKSELFKEMETIQRRFGFNYVVDGTNYSDRNDFRPGRKAEEKFGIRRPLFEAGLTKKDIRRFSKNLNLPTFSKPAMACLASRFPYHSKITERKLKVVEEAEEYLKRLGFCWMRVRHHGDIARIETQKSEIKKFLREETRQKIIGRFKRLGFKYITVDIEGYRTGSMNEVL
ncbi:MAG: ATP-dependent sacrificial sulfur transferase LarE [Candidatus Omnitrophica bacterium]|nr:ATP-dependent sacrificial sulfur transferase LarE [Candidatus Omnitrophota bacterium]